MCTVAAAMQLVPLDSATIEAVSPSTERLLREYSIGYAASGVHALSIGPERSLLGVGFLVSFALLLLGLDRRFSAAGTGRLSVGLAALGLCYRSRRNRSEGERNQKRLRVLDARVSRRHLRPVREQAPLRRVDADGDPTRRGGRGAPDRGSASHTARRLAQPPAVDRIPSGFGTPRTDCGVNHHGRRSRAVALAIRNRLPCRRDLSARLVRLANADICGAKAGGRHGNCGSPDRGRRMGPHRSRAAPVGGRSRRAPMAHGRLERRGVDRAPVPLDRYWFEYVRRCHALSPARRAGGAFRRGP